MMAVETFYRVVIEYKADFDACCHPYLEAESPDKDALERWVVAVRQFIEQTPGAE